MFRDPAESTLDTLTSAAVNLNTKVGLPSAAVNLNMTVGREHKQATDETQLDDVGVKNYTAHGTL